MRYTRGQVRSDAVKRYRYLFLFLTNCGGGPGTQGGEVKVGVKGVARGGFGQAKGKQGKETKENKRKKDGVH